MIEPSPWMSVTSRATRSKRPRSMSYRLRSITPLPGSRSGRERHEPVQHGDVHQHRCRVRTGDASPLRAVRSHEVELLQDTGAEHPNATPCRAAAGDLVSLGRYLDSLIVHQVEQLDAGSPPAADAHQPGPGAEPVLARHVPN